jgi:hypothetical protein
VWSVGRGSGEVPETASSFLLSLVESSNLEGLGTPLLVGSIKSSPEPEWWSFDFNTSSFSGVFTMECTANCRKDGTFRENSPARSGAVSVEPQVLQGLEESQDIQGAEGRRGVRIALVEGFQGGELLVFDPLVPTFSVWRLGVSGIALLSSRYRLSWGLEVDFRFSSFPLAGILDIRSRISFASCVAMGVVPFGKAFEFLPSLPLSL